MNFLKSIDWQNAITVLVVSVVALVVYDMWFADSVTERKSSKMIEE